MPRELAEDLYSSHSYQEIVEPGRLGGGYNTLSKKKNRGATIEEEMKLVKMLTSFHKYQHLQLVVPGSDTEKWYKFIQTLAGMD